MKLCFACGHPIPTGSTFCSCVKRAIQLNASRSRPLTTYLGVAKQLHELKPRQEAQLSDGQTIRVCTRYKVPWSDQHIYVWSGGVRVFLHRTARVYVL